MWKRLDTMEGVLNEGDKVKVKIIGTDPKTGKFKLSRKVLLPLPYSLMSIPKYFLLIINAVGIDPIR